MRNSYKRRAAPRARKAEWHPDMGLAKRYGLTTKQIAEAKAMASARGYDLRRLLAYQALVAEANCYDDPPADLEAQIEEARAAVLETAGVATRAAHVD
jgi:hypothetical protein